MLFIILARFSTCYIHLRSVYFCIQTNCIVIPHKKIQILTELVTSFGNLHNLCSMKKVKLETNQYSNVAELELVTFNWEIIQFRRVEPLTCLFFVSFSLWWLFWLKLCIFDQRPHFNLSVWFISCCDVLNEKKKRLQNTSEMVINTNSISRSLPTQKIN